MPEEKYNFYLQWNMGDMYWDDFPKDEEFTGTFDELQNYLNENYSYGVEMPKGWQEQLLNSEAVLDEIGDIVRVFITDHFKGEIW